MAFQTDTLTVAGLKKLTRDLRRALLDVTSSSVPLNKAQEIVARQLGHTNWHEAYAKANLVDHPSRATDTGLDPRDPYLTDTRRRWKFDELDPAILEAKFKDVDLDTLKKRGFHVLPTAVLRAAGDPLTCWLGQRQPIKEKDIRDCLAAGQESLPDTPQWSETVREKRLTIAESRQRHIQKVAYFVRHPSTSPISIDVGVPELGCNPVWLVDDGNHRLASALIRGDRFIAVEVGGSVNEAKARGMWNPTPEEQEVNRRGLLEWNARQSAKPKSARTIR